MARVEGISFDREAVPARQIDPLFSVANEHASAAFQEVIDLEKLKQEARALAEPFVEEYKAASAAEQPDVVQAIWNKMYAAAATPFARAGYVTLRLIAAADKGSSSVYFWEDGAPVDGSAYEKIMQAIRQGQLYENRAYPVLQSILDELLR